MKKIIALIMCLGMILTLVACGAKTDPGTTEGGTEGDVQPLKVIYVGSKLGDNSTSDAINEGMKKAEADFGIEYVFVESPSAEPAKFPSVMAEAVDMEPDIIVSGAGSGMIDVAIASAKINPDIKYVTLDAPINQEGVADLDNWVGCMAKQNECSFLVGYLAGLMTESNKISGTVGVEYPVLCDFIVGYIDGAVLANPDVKVSVGVIGDFLDQAKAKEIGLAQIRTGCDVLYAIAGPASFGILEAAKDGGVKAIGVDVDMTLSFVGKDDAQANCIMTSAIKDWGYMAYFAVERVVNGQDVPWGTVEVFGITNGGVTFIQNDIYKTVVPQDIQDKMDELVAKVKSGEIVVKSFFDENGESMSDADYQALKDSVKI